MNIQVSKSPPPGVLMYQVFKTYHFRQPPIKYTFLTIHFEGNATCAKLLNAFLSHTAENPTVFRPHFPVALLCATWKHVPTSKGFRYSSFFFFSQVKFEHILGLYLLKQPCKTCGWKKKNINIGNRILYLQSRCETLKSNSCQAIKKTKHCYTCMLHRIFYDLIVIKIWQNNFNHFFMLSITK